MPRYLPPGRKKGPPESHRECRGCHIVFPLTIEHFTSSRTSRNGFLLSCRPCRQRERKLEAAHDKAWREKRQPPKVIKPGQVCDAPDGCYGLARRVRGRVCRHCGLRYAEEPRPELQLRRSVG